MSGNRMAYPLLISLMNIDLVIHSKISLHSYFLLVLLPIAKFTHKQSHIHSLLQDQLTHATLNKVLEPLKMAACVGYMMSDPVRNLCYCYTPLAGYIVDTPEQTLLACMGPKASPFTTATSKRFGEPVFHAPCTGSHTICAIQRASEQCSPKDWKAFLKFAKALALNGVVKPFWDRWPLSCPSIFLHIETLHHFHRFAWDHDVKWCIEVVTPAELDFWFSLLQTPVGYCAFDDGISKLKQVTGCDHCAVQWYIVGVIAGVVPPQFLITIHALLDFHYLTQAPVFSDQSLDRLTEALQVFHDNKDTVIQASGQKESSNWEIPKLELLQSVVSDIRHSGPVWQLSADATEHAHVQEIKNPARMGNNQNYYDQIACHLNHSNKCFRFNLATYLETQGTKSAILESNDDFDQGGEDHDDIDDIPSHGQYLEPSRQVVNYFSVADSLAHGCIPNTLRPHRTFATSTTAFHFAIKPSLCLSVNEAAACFKIPDLHFAIANFLQHIQNDSDHLVTGVHAKDPHCPLVSNHIQIWYRLCIQQFLYHGGGRVDDVQTLCALPPSNNHPHGLYDAVIMSPKSKSDWPQQGIEGLISCAIRMNHCGSNMLIIDHTVVQL